MTLRVRTSQGRLNSVGPFNALDEACARYGAEDTDDKEDEDEKNAVPT